MATEIVTKNLLNVLKNVAELGAQYAIDVRLVAVSKTFPSDFIYVCYQKGQRHFGENYVDELELKANDFASRGISDICWHYIGRLQSNKIKKICSINGLWCIETLDNIKHCDLIQTIMKEKKLKLKVFIQVNISGEKNKGGIEPEGLNELVNYIENNCPNLLFIGLMTIGSISESKNCEINSDFELLVKLRNELEIKLNKKLELSMGMSNDYQLAIKYGSNNVRIGSTIFGQRTYPIKNLDIFFFKF
ncbi:Ala_racemase_N domain-containing protein [Meloidogyne graminicola]|uniref:Pyridoxal phosphate homeostasis protein n=1 Tax=Meloidogyne graminicola TaxID=189291 RepID=A0A8T0A212_9BILA|nr:Ala_racemase_N domain-containing protein [Meloidogyne graminicola]